MDMIIPGQYKICPEQYIYKYIYIYGAKQRDQDFQSLPCLPEKKEHKRVLLPLCTFVNTLPRWNNVWFVETKTQLLWIYYFVDLIGWVAFSMMSFLPS